MLNILAVCGNEVSRAVGKKQYKVNDTGRNLMPSKPLDRCVKVKQVINYRYRLTQFDGTFEYVMVKLI